MINFVVVIVVCCRRRRDGRQREDTRLVDGRMAALGEGGNVVGRGEKVCGAEAVVGVWRGVARG